MSTRKTIVKNIPRVCLISQSQVGVILFSKLIDFDAFAFRR